MLDAMVVLCVVNNIVIVLSNPEREEFTKVCVIP